MDFKKGSTYTRDEIHTLYHGTPVPKIGTGNWTSGYVRIKDELIVFMNINVAGRTGHDFPNSYDHETQTIEWFGKPNTNSNQPIFVKLLNGELLPHFFARWDNTNPSFTYLGVGRFVKYVDGHPTVFRNGNPTTTIKLTVSVADAGDILPFTDDEDNRPSFALEKYLEEFIVSNWNNLDLGQKYDLHEEVIDGIRKKFRTDTGEIDIFAISKDRSEYLVIELKKGRPSDSVVGQIQRYMGFVKAEVANIHQEVKGLIIALEDDQKIQRALSVGPNIGFSRYELKFDLVEIN